MKAWLIGWDRSLKTKANYHGLLFGVFSYAVEQGWLTANPCARTAPKRSREPWWPTYDTGTTRLFDLEPVDVEYPERVSRAIWRNPPSVLDLT